MKNGLQKIICDIGIGAWNVCKAVCFEVVCEGDLGMLLFCLALCQVLGRDFLNPAPILHLELLLYFDSYIIF